MCNCLSTRPPSAKGTTTMPLRGIVSTQEKGGWPRVVGPASARKESEAARLEDSALASVAPYALLPTMKSYGDQEQVTSGGCKQGGNRES